jgi:hypothetical protein
MSETETYDPESDLVQTPALVRTLTISVELLQLEIAGLFDLSRQLLKEANDRIDHLTPDALLHWHARSSHYSAIADDLTHQCGERIKLAKQLLEDSQARIKAHRIEIPDQFHEPIIDVGGGSN